MGKKLIGLTLTFLFIFTGMIANLNADQLATDKTEKHDVDSWFYKNETWGDRLALYFPNRLVDMADMIDISLGFGPTARAKVWVTRYMAFGGGIGGSAKAIKAYNRQYGAGLQSGWDGSFMMLTAANLEMYESTRDVQTYFEHYKGIPSLNNSVYNFWKGPKDMFSIGAEAAAFVEVDVEVHPFEIFDFLAGIFFLDPKGDDFTMQDLQQ
ncbi:MAG TPA: hypothetical protein QF753_09390 [Victivallales bacterium]|nr:hypothetical protein [Victivallales bacterium]